jgi:hypothetical protein
MPHPRRRRPAGVLVLGALGASVLVLGCELGKPKLISAMTAPPPASSRSDAAAGDPGPSKPVVGPNAPPPISLSDAGAPADAASAPEDGAANTVLVYAHSGSDLFRVDPQTLQISRVGNFIIKGPPDRYLNNVTDIAIDRDGHMTGITFDQLLAINPDNGECKLITQVRFGGVMNGLSWIRTDNGEEILAATGNEGSVLRIDPNTGETKIIGNLGAGMRSSGDLVSVSNYGTLITLRGDGLAAKLSPDGSDLLAKVDPVSGAATVIGPTMFKHVYGIGFWGNRVFGFTESGEFILIDPKTGAGRLVQKITAYPFWGAGVSTSAPVTID